MRHSTVLVLTAAALLAVAIPSPAKPPFVKKAQDLGFKEVTNCAACHKGKMTKDGPFTDMGQYLADQKVARKADVVDIAWLKGYKKK